MKRFIKGSAFVVIKGGLGILTTLILSSLLSPEAFSLWVILLSIGVFITLSDLGLGQYIVVDLVSIKEKYSISKIYEDDNINLLLSRYAYLYLLLSSLFISIGTLYLIIFFNFTSLAYWKLVVLISLSLISIRLFFIPILAAINAEGRYDERKKLEALSYIIFFLFCLLGRYFNFQYYVYLIFFQVVLLIPSLFFFYKAIHRGLNLNYLKGYASLSVQWCKDIIKKSNAYFIISLSSYVTRIGIPVVVGVSMSIEDIAIIGQATVLFFQGGFQLIDLVVKLLQPKYKKYFNSNSKKLFFIFTFILSFFIYCFSLILDMYWDDFYYYQPFYILMAMMFVVESYIFYNNSMLIMEKSKAMSVAKLMGIRALFLTVMAVLTNYQFFSYAVIFSGLIYIILVSVHFYEGNKV